MTEDLRIFISSTQLDLAESRKETIKFLGILKSDLIAMEVFGSDELKPVDYCLKQLQKCNIFIGVYAERYGTIDPKCGKSITELEYDEAVEMLRTKKLKTLLLYIVDPKAQWPLDLIERDPVNMAKLAKFKQRICSSHTVSFFKDAGDLPFLILRDVFKKVNVYSEKLFKAKERHITKQRTTLDRPIGMEYYGEDLTKLFFGRDKELNALQDQVIKHKMSLLIGASGVGKTSLLCAGLIHRVRETGWKAAIVRPLTDPVRNLKRFLWDQLLQGDLPVEFDLSSVIKAISTAHCGRKVLIIIDQFEDVLEAKNPDEIELLTTSLLNILHSGGENLKILISYRGDIEPHIGTIWQKISGSAQGLPRTYIGSLDENNAKLVLESTIGALGIRVKESRKSTDTLINRVITDLETESFLSGYSGIYPPFIQMVIARICEDKDSRGNYDSGQYNIVGQSKRIIADYLMDQLKYLAGKINIGKSILIALVSSYATKVQKTLEEITIESMFSKIEVENTLNLLIDLRLVRNVNGSYEIAHDFLAKIITMELVSAEEREAKKFKDLLSTRTAAYNSTKAGLTRAEHLYIYRLRNKILCTDDEVKLLLESYLSGNGPICYWARRYPQRKLISWTRQLISDRDTEIKEAAYRFLIKLGSPPPFSTLAGAFSGYKQQHELSRYITDYAERRDIELLIKLNRKRAEKVAEASETALIKLVEESDKEVLEKLARSKSPNTILTFEKISLNLSKKFSLADIRSGLHAKEFWRRLLSIYALGNKGNSGDFVNINSIQKSDSPQKIRTAVIKATTRLAMRLGNSKVLKEHLSARNKLTVEKTLEAIDMPCKVIEIKELFKLYKKHPFLVSRAILSISTQADMPELKRILSRIHLDPPARELVYALCKIGSENEFSFLFKLFINYQENIVFWNSFDAVNRISNIATRSHVTLLQKIIRKKEFWSYYIYRDRPQSKIVVGNFDNIYFIKRLAGTAFGKVASRAQFSLIFKMLCHEYWIVWNAALEAIRRYGSSKDIGPLLETAIANPSESHGVIEAICIIDDKDNLERVL